MFETKYAVIELVYDDETCNRFAIEVDASNENSDKWMKMEFKANRQIIGFDTFGLTEEEDITLRKYLQDDRQWEKLLNYVLKTATAAPIEPVQLKCRPQYHCDVNKYVVGVEETESLTFTERQEVSVKF